MIACNYLLNMNVSSVNATTTLTHLNDTDSVGYKCQPAELWMRLTSVTVGSVVSLVGGVTNVPTLISIATVKPLWRFSNINIFLLAFFDFFITTYICGHTMEKFWTGCWPYSLFYCRIFNIANGVLYFGSLALLALVSYDRYLMIKHGASYSTKESKYTVMARTSAIMVIVVVFTIPAVNMHWFTGVSINTAPGVCVTEVLQNGTYYLLLNFAGTFVPVGVMLFCYLSVLRYRPLKEVTNNSATTAQLTVRRRASRLIKTMFILLFVTNALYFVTTIVISMFAAGYWLWLDTIWWLNLYLGSYTVAWINNAFNPILYVHTMPDFQRAAETVWQQIYTTVRTAVWWMPKYIVAKQAVNGAQRRRSNDAIELSSWQL